MSRTGADHFIGTILNESYEVQRLLGKGGMGAVYEGVNVRLGRRVAIKVLSNLAVDDPEVVHRFRREAKLATDLAHPHIIDVLDFNETVDGVPYMVMEQLSGQDLETLIRCSGTVPVERVAFIIRQICSALHAAHTSSVVHRDLKPANVFLCDNKAFADFAVVLDFGISKVLGSSSLKTGDDLVIGTPHYMAPEQVDRARGKIGPATDIFAIGAIMYQMLAGAMPFEADSAPALLYALVHKEPEPLAALQPELDQAVVAVVERALAKSPQDRFSSVLELSTALCQAVPNAAPLAGREWEREASDLDLASAAAAAAAVAATVPPSGADRVALTLEDGALGETLPSGQVEAQARPPISTLSAAASQKIKDAGPRPGRSPLMIASAVLVVAAVVVAVVVKLGATDDGQPRRPAAAAADAVHGAAGQPPDAARPADAARLPDAQTSDARPGDQPQQATSAPAEARPVKIRRRRPAKRRPRRKPDRKPARPDPTDDLPNYRE